MSNNTVKARVQVKADTTENWKLYGDSFIPLLREPIFYTDTGRIKLGDGIHTVNELDYNGSYTFAQEIEPTAAQDGDMWLQNDDQDIILIAEGEEF